MSLEGDFASPLLVEQSAAIIVQSIDRVPQSLESVIGRVATRTNTLTTDISSDVELFVERLIALGIVESL